jgi:hypothetical protein
MERGANLMEENHMTLKDRILNELESENYLSDRELADRISGDNSPQQSINQTCRLLEANGLIKRTSRPIKNYIPSKKSAEGQEQLETTPITRPTNTNAEITTAGRSEYLKNEFNEFWNAFWGTDKDYYSEMPLERLSLLKTAVSNINNLITYETTLSAARIIFKILGQGKTDFEHVLSRIEAASANANGFDIECKWGTPYICEVKANLPVGGGKDFGAAQRQQIEKDIHSLLNGKAKSRIRSAELSSYYKFLCFYAGNQQVYTAVERLIPRLSSNVKTKIMIYHNGISLNTDMIYVLFS